MQIKIVTLDVRLSENTKRAIRWVLLPVAVLAGSMAVARAYTTTWIATGQPMSATNLKGNLDEIQNRLAAVEGQVHPGSAFQAWLTNSVSIPNNAPAPYTTVAFDHVAFDLAGEYTAATGVFKPQQAGQYLVVCDLSFSQTTTGAAYSAMVQTNGTIVVEDDIHSARPNSISSVATGLIQLAANDSVTCTAFQVSGGSIALNAAAAAAYTAFSATRIH